MDCDGNNSIRYSFCVGYVDVIFYYKSKSIMAVRVVEAKDSVCSGLVEDVLCFCFLDSYYI